MKIILAPDSFKGSLTAKQAAQIMERAAKEVFDCDTRCIPVADGGEGTLEAIVDAAGGSYVEKVVTGPLGQPVAARYGLIDGGRTAVVELAEASGITLANPKNPLRATTRGTGELIRAAAEAGAQRIIVGIGGSATNDGGMGLLTAMGMRFLDSDGTQMEGCGEELEKVASIDATDLMSVEMTVICDVTNPLLGPNGATAVYGPQKGADADMLERLEKGMAHYAEMMCKAGFADSVFSGAGAAGGVGYALAGVMGATLKSGIDAVLDAVHFEKAMRDADLVITGEGRLDEQTVRYGKVPAGIVRQCKSCGVPVLAVAGSLGDGAEAFLNMGQTAMEAITERPMELREAVERAEELLYRATVRTLTAIRLGMNMKR